MISLIKSQIDNVTVELTVEETIGSQLGGYPTLLIGDVNIESCMVAEVDTLAVIKAIATSETVEDFEWKTKDCWNAKKFATILKAFVALDYTPDHSMMVEDTMSNSVWLKAIHKEDDIFCDDESTPWERTVALAKIYDYRKHLTFVPMPDELRGVLDDE